MSGPSQAPRRLIWIMAWRLLRSRRGPYLSAVTLVSLAGVVLGVASLLVIFAITSGFEEVFRDKLLGVYPHAIVIGGGADVADYRTVERLAMTAPGVVHAAAATYDQMMISHRGRRAGVLIKGIRREDSPAIRQLRERLSGGDLDGLDASLSLRREGPVVHATRSPGGLDWVVVAWPDGDLEVLPPCVEEIPREDALLRVQVPPGRRITVTLEDPLEAHSLDVAPEDDGRTPWVRVFAGEVLAMVDGTRVVLDVAPGRAWTLAVSGDRWHLAEDRPPRRGDTPSHVSLVNLGREALSLRSGPGTELAIPGGTARVEVAGSFLPGVILGVELAATLGVGSGDEVSLVSPLQGLDRFLRETAGSRPVADTFRVAGLLDLGFYEYDSKLALIDFEQALRFLHRGDRARWVEITTRDLLELEEITRSLEASLASFRLDDLHAASAGMARRTSRILEDLPPPAEPSGGVARAAWLQDLAESLRYGPAELLGLGIRQDARIITWREMNQAMFTAMQRQRLVLSLFFLIIIIVAASNIVGSQTMMVREKLPQISLLKVLGLTPRDIRRLFTLHGLAIGAAGALLGLALGAGIGIALDRIGFPLDPVVYYVSRLPVALRWGDMLFVTAAAVLLVLVAVRIAASRAATRTPVEGLIELE